MPFFTWRSLKKGYSCMKQSAFFSWKESKVFLDEDSKNYCFNCQEEGVGKNVDQS